MSNDVVLIFKQNITKFIEKTAKKSHLKINPSRQVEIIHFLNSLNDEEFNLLINSFSSIEVDFAKLSRTYVKKMK